MKTTNAYSIKIDYYCLENDLVQLHPKRKSKHLLSFLWESKTTTNSGSLERSRLKKKMMSFSIISLFIMIFFSWDFHSNSSEKCAFQSHNIETN